MKLLRCIDSFGKTLRDLWDEYINKESDVDLGEVIRRIAVWRAWIEAVNVRYQNEVYPYMTTLATFVLSSMIVVEVSLRIEPFSMLYTVISLVSSSSYVPKIK